MGIDELLGSESLVLFQDGDQVSVATENTPVRFLLISGKSIGDPITWHGPIVMTKDISTIARSYFKAKGCI